LSPRSREVTDHAGTNLISGAATARHGGKAPTMRGARLLPLVPLPCRTTEREREGSRSSRSTHRRRGLRWLGRSWTRGGGGAQAHGVKERESERERKMERAGHIIYDPVAPARLARQPYRA
jgi:hypothetical protein